MYTHTKTYQLNRNGSSQFDRKTQALSTDQKLIDAQKAEDLIEFAQKYASELTYFNFGNTSQGDWQFLWEKTKDKTLEEIENLAPEHPELALFLCFLQVLGVAQDELNQLLHKHLVFYYKEILQLKEKSAQADQVHVIFELAKQAKRTLVEADHIALDAGKDSNGQPIFFELTDDTLVSHAQIAKLQSIRVDPNGPKVGLETNSIDGLGEALKDGDAWPTFGRSNFSKAKAGFALASPQLLLKEGTRTITISLSLHSNLLSKFNDSASNGMFEAYFSGLEEWLGPFPISLTGINGSGNTHNIQIQITLDPETPPISFYKEEVLGEKFDTIYPMVKIIALPSINFPFYRAFSKSTVKEIGIQVTVDQIRGLVLENDQGPIDAAKPFMPFGSQPIKGSSFYIGAEEPLLKELESLKLEINWLDTPESFKIHYEGYPEISSLSNSSFKVQIDGLENQSWKAKLRSNQELFDSSDARKAKTIILSPNNGNTTPSVKKAINTYKSSGGLIGIISQPIKARNYFLPQPQLFAYKVLSRYDIKKAVVQKLPQLTRSSRNGFIRFSLLKDFFHKDFPQAYSLAMIDEALEKTDKRPIPNPPYTPMISEISLSYTSKELKINPNNFISEDFEDRGIQLFHLHPFGQTERHANLNVNASEPIQLAPDFRNKGELYIGLAKTNPGEALNLLFQTEIGSANPEKEPPNLSWSILKGDKWIPLKKSELIGENTNGLLRSGIVQLILPSDASIAHTLIDAGLIWLKVSVLKDIDAVSNLLGVFTQGQKATRKSIESFSEQPSLEQNTISKLSPKLGAIKSVSQPYPSEFGQPNENDEDFFIRVSERLRHKNRGISLWDYEHLVLGEFKNIYHVKCLPHYSSNSCPTPGAVTLIVIPDLRELKSFNPLQPKVDLDTLSRIKTFLKSRVSVFSQLNVKNPSYEEIRLDFQIKLHIGFDFEFYKQKLNQAIIEKLSPWNKANSTPISFGGTIHKSKLIQFIEEQEYVDYVSHVKMFHMLEGRSQLDKDEINASSPESILVSAPIHQIQEIK